MSPEEVVERLFNSYVDGFCESLKIIQALSKGDQWIYNDDDLLWHFTRFSVFKEMLRGRQIWLSDLALCNDADEITFGSSRALAVVNDISSKWDNSDHAAIVRKIAKSAVRSWKSGYHVYAFCFSDRKDAVQHWNEYGGGLRQAPSDDDPYIAVAFDGQALFHPIEITADYIPVDVFTILLGDDNADRLLWYWTKKTRAALEQLTGQRILSKKRLYDICERTLLVSCSLVKDEGWQDEHEFRMLYLTPEFGEEPTEACVKPDGRSKYIPFIWQAGKSPIRRVMSHPLAGKASKRSLEQLASKEGIAFEESRIKPRLV